MVNFFLKFLCLREIYFSIYRWMLHSIYFQIVGGVGRERVGVELKGGWLSEQLLRFGMETYLVEIVWYTKF